MTSSKAEVRLIRHNGSLLDQKQFEETKQAYWDWIDSFAQRKYEAACKLPGNKFTLGDCQKQVKGLLKSARKHARKSEIKDYSDYSVFMQMPDGSVVENESLPS